MDPIWIVLVVFFPGTWTTLATGYFLIRGHRQQAWDTATLSASLVTILAVIVGAVFILTNVGPDCPACR